MQASPTSTSTTILNQAEAQPDKTVVVLGCSRGGTSMVAGTLRELGVFMGERFTGANHEDVELAVPDAAVARRVIVRRNAAHRVWGWKYPHVLDYLPQVLDDLRNPHFVVVFRNVLDVARSFHKHHGAAVTDSLQDALQRYAQLAGFLASSSQPMLLCSFEDCLKNRPLFVQALAGFLDLELTREAWDRAAGFINSSGGYKHISGGPPQFFMQVRELDQAAFEAMAGPAREIRVASVNMRKEGDRLHGEHSDPQFIVQPQDDEDLGESLLVSFSFQSESADPQSSFYIDFGTGFYPMASYNFRPCNGENRFHIRFQSPIKRLRLDPLNTDAAFQIAEIHIRCTRE